MVRVNFNTDDYRRQVADEADLLLKNRYFEQNPSLSDDGSALLARPGMKKLTSVGSGPIRGLASEAGSFSGDLFVASGAELYRMDNLLNSTLVYNALTNPDKGFVNMAITAVIGNTPEYCFITDGATLLVYVGNGYALNSLTGTPADTDQVRIGDVYYEYTSGSVDSGTPDGTSSNPWLINLGTTTTEAFASLYYAVNASGTPGTDYSTSLTAHPLVLATGYTSTLSAVRARTAGAPGNGIVTTETGASLAWSNGGTLTGGGSPTISQVYMPDDQGVIDVAVINSYVIVVPVQDNGYQGRFYWIDPGETSVDPLNYATAERSPDAIYGVQVFGDQFWLPGESTTEVWYVTGDLTAPMRRLQGIVLDRGSWKSTGLAIHESMVVVDGDGGVFLVRGGTPQRISNPGIEEQIRVAIATQNI